VLLAITGLAHIRHLVYDPLLDEMWLEVLRPIRRRTIRSTPRAEADCPFEIAELHSERGTGRKGVDNQSTAIARVSVAVLGISGCLSRTRRADRVCDDLVGSPSAGVAQFRAGARIAERTAGERLLHYASSSPAPRAAAQPRWKTASCVIESNAVPLGS